MRFNLSYLLPIGIIAVIGIVAINGLALAVPGDASFESYQVLPHLSPPGAPAVEDSLSADTAASKSIDNRLRLMGGIMVVPYDRSSMFPFPIVNASYRISMVRPEPLDIQFGAGFEAGIYYILPYLQMGPELRLKYSVIEAHATAIPGEDFAFMWGIRYGHLFDFTGVAGELQLGFDDPLSPTDGLIWHLMAGVAFR